MLRTVLLSPRRSPHITFPQRTRQVVKFCTVLFITLILLATWCSWNTENLSPENGIPDKRIGFEKHWCRIQRAQVDWESIISPCQGNTRWGNIPYNWENEKPSNAQTSYISYWDINPAGEFSRFFIQSQTAEGVAKTVGGDAWRVHLSGPAYLAPTVLDHGNGSYEVLFLAMEHGSYQAEIVLDYSLCNGLRDPPVDWFIKGNMQGKGQRYPEVDKNRDYIISQLWKGTPVDIFIPKSNVGLKQWGNLGSYKLFTQQPNCGTVCNAIWDGYGRWIQNQWMPYVPNIPKYRDPHRGQGTLCVYGDSLGEFFAASLFHRNICRQAFKLCTKRYNWIYPVLNYTIDKSKDDDLDFNQTRVLDAVHTLLQSEEMKSKSVLIINFGLHYVESVNFTSYQKLIQGLILVFKLHANENRHDNASSSKTRIIWKSSTAINKQRAMRRHLGNRRFLTFQRVLLFNAYATAAMCSAGISVLDVYPISDSYPWGTGTHLSYTPAKNDVVHYSNFAFKPAEDLLELMFQE